MKICEVSVSYPPVVSGVSRAAYVISDAMQKRKHSVSVITVNDNLNFRKEKENNIQVVRVPGLKIGPRKDISIPLVLTKKIYKFLEESNFDVIHIHDPSYLSLFILLYARKKKIPVVATHHFVPQFLSSYYRFLNTKLFHNLIWKYCIFLYNKASFVVTPTNTIQKLLIDNGLVTKSMKISNGVNTKIFKPRKDFKKQYILYLGRLDKDKNIENLLKAYSKTNIKNKYKLVVAGKGGLIEDLKKLSKRLRISKLVDFIGYVSEDKKPFIYNSAYCYIITSKVEAESISTLEAMSSGLAVIASKGTALPEVVKDGINGLLIDSDDSKDISEKIDYLFKYNLIDKFSVMGRKIAVNNFDIEKTFDMYETLYKSLLK